MKANQLKRFFVELPDAVGTFPQALTVSDEFAVHHARNVMRLKAGEEVLLIDGQRERAYRATLDALEKNALRLTMLALTAQNDTDAMPEITLAIALLKEQKWDWVLQKSTELGVRRIQPLIAERSVVKVDDAAKKLVRWQTVLKSAAEQSEGLFIPTVLPPVKLADLKTTEGLHVLLRERGEHRKPLRDILRNEADVQKITLTVGPEGGWTDAEIEALMKAGFVSASLGARILRSETAAMAAVSAMIYEFESV